MLKYSLTGYVGPSRCKAQCNLTNATNTNTLVCGACKDGYIPINGICTCFLIY